jgi:hypothetical protein
MGKLVNLNHARKAAAKRQAAVQAAANRVKHGRTGAQKQADRQAEMRRDASQDGALLDRGRRDDA